MIEARLKYILKTQKGKVPKAFSDDNSFPPYLSMDYLRGENGNVLYVKPKEEYKLIDENQVLVLWDGANAGEVMLSKKGFLSSTMAVVTANSEFFEKRFLFYFLKSIEGELKKASTGTTIPHLDQNFLFNTPFQFPEVEIQKQIADYLHKQCEKITRFIQTKEHFIELLKEQRQSIITHAVTKGIDENVKMKETVLGEIPEHWEVRRLKYIADVRFSTVDKHIHKEERQVKLCNYNDVYKNEYITNAFDFMKATASESEIKNFAVEKGDVIITKDSETPKEIAIPALVIENLENVVCGYHLAQVKSKKELINSEFLFRLFQSKKINSHFEVAAQGVTRYGLSYDDINSAFFLFPKSLTEQEDICKYIKTETRTLDIAISKAEREIELIKEYREAMIAEAVTGKMKGITNEI